MTRFFFHQVREDRRIDGPEGQECTDLASAKVEAVMSARQIAADDLRAGRPARDAAFLIADDSGRVLATLMFADVLIRDVATAPYSRASKSAFAD